MRCPEIHLCPQAAGLKEYEEVEVDERTSSKRRRRWSWSAICAAHGAGRTDQAKEGNIVDGFWAWHDLRSFLIALTVFTAFWSIMTVILIRFQWYVETLGMVSLLVEASLGAPQLIRNWQRKSTQGMSIPMVLAWLCGDLAKTGYFIVTGSPLQFWVCAILQISIDIFILGQVFVYRKNTEGSELPYSSSSPTHSVID